MRKILVVVLCLLLPAGYLWASEVTMDLNKKKFAESNYGPQLPEGEDGQANLDAGKKLQMLYWIGGIALGLLALIAVLSQFEESDKSWN